MHMQNYTNVHLEMHLSWKLDSLLRFIHFVRSIVHCTKRIAELAKLDSIFVHCHRFNFHQLKRKHECK
jgi:hypothetical protein